MSDHAILLVSVVGLAVLVLVRTVFLNPANMERLAIKSDGRGILGRVIPLIGALIVAEICFALMFITLRINPLYSLPLTGGVLVLGLIVIAARRAR